VLSSGMAPFGLLFGLVGLPGRNHSIVCRLHVGNKRRSWMLTAATAKVGYYGRNDFGPGYHDSGA
jgi:hypothetical protein